MSVHAPSRATASTPVRDEDRHSLDVVFRGVGRTFPTADGPRVVLRDVDLTVAPGEVLAVIGASGCGKSTLLRAVAGLDPDFDGELLIDGSPVRPYDERTAVGFQEPRLLPWRTLRRNVELGLPRELDRAAGRDRVQELLELVGLAPFAEHRPREVSGGMAQRASLARALARRPGVLLLDEPFGALDDMTRQRLNIELLRIWTAKPATTLMVTHGISEAIFLSDRVAVMSARPGRVVEVLDVDLPRPRVPEMQRTPEFHALHDRASELLFGTGAGQDAGEGH